MDGSNLLRIDGNARQWGGNNSPQEERQNRRRLKLNALLLCLRAGDMKAAREALVALLNFDPSLSADSYFSKVGEALKNGNLYAAQHFALEFQSRLGSPKSTQAKRTNLPSLTNKKVTLTCSLENHRIDLSA